MIPFNRPYVGIAAESGIARSLASGHLSGDGPETKLAVEKLKLITGSPAILLTPSCTHALELSTHLLQLEPGDEVIVPSFTFTSTANCIVLAGGVPVFVDVEDDTLNISARRIEPAISSRTKAIMVVHYAGVSVDMDPILDLAKKHGLVVLEDNAHGLGGTYKGSPLGTFGSMSTLSFHETKNIQCGEGGALAINDASFNEPAEVFREKGTNRSKFFRGQVDKYTWVSAGSSLLLSDILAGALNGQLDSFEEIQSKRSAIWETYFKELQSWAINQGVRLPTLPEYSRHPSHLFYMRTQNLSQRSKLMDHCKLNQVSLTFHYQSLHSSEAGLRYGKSHGDMSVTEAATDDLVRLPIWPEMSNGEIAQVIESILTAEL